MRAEIVGNPDVNYMQGKGYIVSIIAKTWKLERIEVVFASFLKASQFASNIATVREIEL